MNSQRRTQMISATCPSYSSILKTTTDATLSDDVSLSIRGPNLDSHTMKCYSICMPCMSVSNTNIPPTSGLDISDKMHPIANNVQPRMYQNLLQNFTLPKVCQTQSPIQSPVPLSSTSTTSSLALPNYPTTSQQPFTWSNLTRPEFTKLLDTVCEEVLLWRHNCYSVPNGKVGRDFVN